MQSYIRIVLKQKYDGFVIYVYKRDYRVKHSEDEFADGHNQIDGIGNYKLHSGLEIENHL